MRSYLAMELIGTFWFMGAVLARSENLDRLWIACATVAVFYFLRAIIKYFTKKEKGHVEDINLRSVPGTYASGMRMRNGEFQSTRERPNIIR